jgi:hypothetical protein
MVIQAIVDGYLVGYNGYDNQMYVFGKGPSATTVSASPKVSVFGSSVLVEGYVTDISPGTEEYARTSRFPNGVPAIADQSQSAWMEYLYQQQPLPTDTKGVDVIVEVFDPNSNYHEVGRTTSDATGFFKLAFTPEVPGEYTIVTRFPGSESYWSSYAETGLSVEEGTAPTAAPTQAPASLADQYFIPVSIVMIVAILAVLFLAIFRKR